MARTSLLLVLVTSTLGCFPQPNDSVCVPGALEPDFKAAPFGGPGLVDGALQAGTYVVAATYLRLKPSSPAMQLFSSLLPGIEKQIPEAEGLVAWSTGGSNNCLTGRTLTIWRDEQSLRKFVSSGAHVSAMGKTSELSRPGSATTHWTGDETTASFEHAATRLSTARPLQ